MINLVFSTAEDSMSLDVAVRQKALFEGEEDYSLFPESGLHPSKHMDVTEGLFKAYNTDNVWVATHSELVILRAMRMIREKRATTKDFKLWQYCGDYMVQIELSEEGEFLDHIKGGFFEEGFNERFA